MMFRWLSFSSVYIITLSLLFTACYAAPLTTYIVSFHTYQNQSDHFTTLRGATDHVARPSSSHAEVIDWTPKYRYNRATSLPTDFVLVTTDNTDIQNVYHPTIKRITRDHSLRTLSHVKTNGPMAYDNDIASGFDQANAIETKPTVERVDVAPIAFRRFAFPDAAMTDDLTNNRVNGTPPSMHASEPRTRRLLQNVNSDSVSHKYHADALWKRGFHGRGIRIAIFDTGLSNRHPHFRNIIDRSNWTDEQTLDDGIGHGTFVAGVIASGSSECSGFAREAELFIFRVFNQRQLSFTSWFLDAFNYALQSDIDVLNLSIGGPDFLDTPFVDKVLELSANGIIVVSAIGNDGPLYGTLNNPADQMDVIGVGGIDGENEGISSFSSRGMTTWELPAGYGRVKPDVVALAKSVRGSKIGDGCKTLSGTSVASPVVAGAVVLLASTIPEERRATLLNPAKMKQALVEGSKRIPNANVFEQGMGKLDLLAAYDALQAAPHASVIPATLDLTDCPYMWPYCTQELYFSQQPTMLNLTLLNSMSVSGYVQATPKYTPATTTDDVLDVSFDYPQTIWPWTSYFAISITVKTPLTEARIVRGEINITVISDSGMSSLITIPLTASIIPTPPRERRLLWDQYHNLRYPSGYFPRDNLEIKTDTLDWNGDHIHTNFKEMYEWIRRNHYYIEVIGKELTCFDASLYGALMIVDSEDEFTEAEKTKLKKDVNEFGLSLIIIADWYNVNVMRDVKFYDENTASWWSAETGGSNVPALNDLLSFTGIAFSHHVVKGKVSVHNEVIYYASGTTIARFPAGGHVYSASLTDAGSGAPNRQYAIYGLLDLAENINKSNSPITGRNGRIAVYGDSNCLDMNNRHHALCTSLLSDIIVFAMTGNVANRDMFPVNSKLTNAYVDTSVATLPTRMIGNNLHKYSKTIRHRRDDADHVSAEGVCSAVNEFAEDQTPHPFMHTATSPLHPADVQPITPPMRGRTRDWSKPSETDFDADAQTIYSPSKSLAQRLKEFRTQQSGTLIALILLLIIILLVMMVAIMYIDCTSLSLPTCLLRCWRRDRQSGASVLQLTRARSHPFGEKDPSFVYA